MHINVSVVSVHKSRRLYFGRFIKIDLGITTIEISGSGNNGRYIKCDGSPRSDWIVRRAIGMRNRRGGGRHIK